MGWEILKGEWAYHDRRGGYLLLSDKLLVPPNACRCKTDEKIRRTI